MENYLYSLKKASLFEGFSNKEVLDILKCLGAVVVSHQKDEAVFIAGSNLVQIGIVLEGRLQLQKEDIYGNLVMIDQLMEGDVFGEAFVCAGVSAIPITVWSLSKSKIMLLDYSKIITLCPSGCVFHTRIIKNLLRTLAQKLIKLNQKADILQKGSIREKLMLYFEQMITENKSRSFILPFNREELAEYLGVNRSALSREFSKLREDGLIEFSGHDVTIN